MIDLEDDFSILGIATQPNDVLLYIADDEKKVSNQTENALSRKKRATLQG